MELFTIDENNKLIKENCELSSERYAWIRKNRKVFMTEEEAYKYLINQPPVSKDQAYKHKFGLYASVKNKDDFNKLFDVNLTEKDYVKIKDVMDYLLK